MEKGSIGTSIVLGGGELIASNVASPSSTKVKKLRHVGK